MKKLVFILLMLPLVASARFDRNLYFGMRNDPDVKQLQIFLHGRGYFPYVANGNYFQTTVDAVKKFQKAYKLPVVSGYFGPQSRARANSLLSPAGQVLGGQSVLSGAPVSIYTPTIPPPPSPTSVISAVSPYKEKIIIAYSYGSGDRPEDESIVIENRTEKEKIVITGFSLINSRGASFIIPLGNELPGSSGPATDPIILKPGDYTKIIPGRQQTWLNFRDNICTGYLDESVKFKPSLSHRCPSIETHGLTYLSDRCLQIIQSTTTCRQPDWEQAVDSECSDFLNANLNYAGCVRNNRTRPNFYLNEWRVWMQRDGEFIRNVSETIVLKDQQGREVDRYSY